ncbi:MAG TPA: hypothetical protein VLI72_17595 [Methylibium sp.]|nr:hypothetical protein [Methylibium sp.]
MAEAAAGAMVAALVPAESVLPPGLVQRSSGFVPIAFTIAC